MQIENLITKRSRLDRRYKLSQQVNTWLNRKTIAAGLYGLIIGGLAGAYIADNPARSQINAPAPLEQKIEVKEVEAQETKERFCVDVIKCIRDVGDELGKDNQTIMTMIRIARFESNYNPKAKNKNSSASGVFQIIAGTWYSNDCVGDKWNAEDNIRCAYKIQSKRGFQPWEVWNNGLAK